MFLKIPLVVLLGPIERRCRRDLRDDWTGESAGVAPLLLRGDRCRLLCFVVVKERRSILGATVRTLPVERGRIVAGPEHVQEVLVTDPVGVVAHFPDLGTTGTAGAHILVGRVGERTPQVTGDGVGHARNLAERHFYTPEAPGAKGGLLQLAHVFLSFGLPPATNGGPGSFPVTPT